VELNSLKNTALTGPTDPHKNAASE